MLSLTTDGKLPGGVRLTVPDTTVGVMVSFASVPMNVAMAGTPSIPRNAPRLLKTSLCAQLQTRIHISILQCGHIKFLDSLVAQPAQLRAIINLAFRSHARPKSEPSMSAAPGNEGSRRARAARLPIASRRVVDNRHPPDAAGARPAAR
jgi:hypothetical protein